VWTIGSGGFIGSVTLMPITREDVLRAVQRRRQLMFLTYLFIHPLRRGLGWSHELLRAATEWADAQRIDLWLYARPYGLAATKRGRVHKANEEELLKLYRKHGFRVIEGAGHRNEMVRRCRAPKY
jgi:Acetyltransferase (GNAT) family.